MTLDNTEDIILVIHEPLGIIISNTYVVTPLFQNDCPTPPPGVFCPKMSIWQTF